MSGRNEYTHQHHAWWVCKKFLFIYLFYFAVLRIQLKVSFMLGRCLFLNLYSFWFFFSVIQKSKNEITIKAAYQVYVVVCLESFPRISK
jgi:hypothetical protein